MRDTEGRRPNRYRLTTIVLETLGVASLEELHARVAPLLTADSTATSPSGHDANPATAGGGASG